MHFWLSIPHQKFPNSKYSKIQNFGDIMSTLKTRKIFKHCGLQIRDAQLVLDTLKRLLYFLIFFKSKKLGMQLSLCGGILEQ